jgi:predicted CoA-binding protein
MQAIGVNNNQSVKSKYIKDVKAILLVDWADESIPRSLAEAGFRVFSYSPDKYSEAAIDNGKLVFNRLTQSPEAVDVVYVYRPEAEHGAIIEKHVLPLKAKTLWLHPPVQSASTAALAASKGLIFIEGVDIRDAITKN